MAHGPSRDNGGGEQLPAALYLVPVPIGNLADLASRSVTLLRCADAIACEDTRMTGQLLKLNGLPKRRMFCIEAHREAGMVESICDAIAEGRAVALVTDGGTPGVSDPGNKVVDAVIRRGLKLVSVPGPSAATAAWAASGFSGPWTVVGFIARKGRDRRERLQSFAASSGSTVLYEHPGRVRRLLEDLSEVLAPDRLVSLSKEISKIHERHWRGTTAELLVAMDPKSREKGEWTVVVGPAAAPGDVPA